jgi:hypothetical protein
VVVVVVVVVKLSILPTPTINNTIVRVTKCRFIMFAIIVNFWLIRKGGDVGGGATTYYSACEYD